MSVSPLAMRFSTMSMRMYVPVLLMPSLCDRDARGHMSKHTGSSKEFNLVLTCQDSFLLPAVNDDWAGATSVAFVHLPEKQGNKGK